MKGAIHGIVTQVIELILEKRHLFAIIENERFLVDTGAPNSFAKVSSIKLIEDANRGGHVVISELL